MTLALSSQQLSETIIMPQHDHGLNPLNQNSKNPNFIRCYNIPFLFLKYSIIWKFSSSFLATSLNHSYSPQLHSKTNLNLVNLLKSRKPAASANSADNCTTYHTSDNFSYQVIPKLQGMTWWICQLALHRKQTQLPPGFYRHFSIALCSL